VAEIPSDIATSAGQAGFKAQDVGKTNDAERTGQADAAKRQIRIVDEVEVTVETTDDNTKVFADAEGSGSEGRSEEEETSSDEEPGAPEPHRGITTDQDGTQHVDLEA